MTGARRHHHDRSRGEDGVAMLWAIIIMLVVLGLLIVVAMASVGASRESRDSASRTRAVMWAQAAAKDLRTRIHDAELGPWVTSVRPNGDYVLGFASPGNPAGIATPTRTTFSNGGSTRAIPITATSGGATQRGWYQVLPAVAGAPPWTGLGVRDAARPGEQGAIQFVIRAWHDSTRAQPVLVRMEFRQATLARFSVLSEDRLQLGGIGTLQLGGFIHTNNAQAAPVAIDVGVGTSLGTARVTTTTGAITRCGGANCRSNIREVVSFGSAARAMNRIERLSARGRCTGATFAACRISWPPGFSAGAGRMPVWIVELDAGNCIRVGRASGPLRTDTGNVPALNDRVGPTAGPSAVQELCPAGNGGAVLLDGDVVLVGLRAATAPPVTIMARRSIAFPRISMNGEIVTATLPASIYLQQRGNGRGVGAASAAMPVGAVAQGGVYMPSWAMRSVNDQLNVRNLAAMAVTGEIAYSPSIQSIATDGSAPGGLGISPGAARGLQYGYGSQLSFTGALLSSGRMSFRYGQGADYIGYGRRDFAYVPSLVWNAPPFFPSDADWHLADWTEFE